MIFTDRTITVRKGESRIDEPIVVYRGDYELEVRFTILNSRFKFKSGVNMIESEKASYGQLAILTPYGGNIFSDIVRCNDGGSVTFVLTADMLNQIEEVGLYSFQIRLMDYNKESRVSIPPIVFGIEVREPIASEDHDNSVNNAIVGYSIAKVVNPSEENVGDTFDKSGNYNKTKWETGDRISEGKLNKIEDAIDKVNKNEVNSTATLSKRIDNNFSVLSTTKADVTDLDVERSRINNLVSLQQGSTTGDAELIDGRVGTDGSIYTTLGESIREQIKTSMTEFIGLPLMLTLGGYIHYDNGILTPYDDDSRGYSDYVRLLPESTTLYLRNINYILNDLAGLAFYDENKNFISGYQYNQTMDIVIEVPNGSAYVRFTFMNHGNNAKYAGKVTAYQSIIPFILDNTNEINKIKKELTSLNDKLLQKTIIPEAEMTDTYVTSNGRLGSSDNYMVSRPITITKGDVLFITATGYKSNVSILSEYGGGYTPLIISEDGITEYVYMAEKNMRVCLSCHTIYDYKIDIVGDLYGAGECKRMVDKIILPYTISDGYINCDTGRVTTDQCPSGLANTGNMWIFGMSKLYIYGLNYRTTDLAGMGFYDAYNVCISTVQYTPCVDLEVDVPKNAVYVRLTVVRDSLPVITVDEREYINSCVEDGKKGIHDVYYYYEYELTPSTYISNNDGKLIQHDNPLYKTTGYIKLPTEFEKIEIYHGSISTDLASFAFYDANFACLEATQLNSNKVQSAVIPEGAVYLRATIKTQQNEDYIRSIYSLIDRVDVLYENVAELLDPDKPEDTFNYCQIFHKIAGIGDSLMSGEIAYIDPETGAHKYVDCHNYSWLSNLCKNIGAQAVHYSSGGRTVKTWLDGFLDKMKSETEKPSAYYIALGTNDTIRLDGGLGDPTDCDTDIETFYGLYSRIIREVKSFNPNATIFCLSLYFGPTSQTTINFCAAIKYMAEKYGCYYIDFVNAHPEYSVSGEIRDKFISVGHFTTHGYVRVGQEILELTNKVIRDNSDDFKFVSQYYMNLK